MCRGGESACFCLLPPFCLRLRQLGGGHVITFSSVVRRASFVATLLRPTPWGKSNRVVPWWSKGDHRVVPKWSQGGPKVVPGWFSKVVPGGSQGGPKVVPGESQGGPRVLHHHFLPAEAPACFQACSVVCTHIKYLLGYKSS